DREYRLVFAAFGERALFDRAQAEPLALLVHHQFAVRPAHPAPPVLVFGYRRIDGRRIVDDQVQGAAALGELAVGGERGFPRLQSIELQPALGHGDMALDELRRRDAVLLRTKPVARGDESLILDVPFGLVDIEVVEVASFDPGYLAAVFGAADTGRLDGLGFCETTIVVAPGEGQ